MKNRDFAQIEDEVDKGFARLKAWENDVFFAWLKSSDWNISVLIEWLGDSNLHRDYFLDRKHGLGVGGVASFLADILDRVHFDPQPANSFKSRLAAFLYDAPEVYKPGKDPKKVLYNALMLCYRLAKPGFFYGPLLEMHRRNKLQGAFGSSDLRTTFMWAIVCNQKDMRLLPWWEKMYYEGYSDFLTLDEKQIRHLGLRGIFHLPRIEEQKDQWLDVIVRLIETKLEDRGTLNTHLIPFMVDMADVSRHINQGFYEELLIKARERKWAKWAIDKIEKIIYDYEHPDIMARDFTT